MTMELEGNLSLERAHTRRWVAVVAVIVPVAAVVLLAAWFVRVYVVPPTIVIPSPMLLAEAPPAPAQTSRAEAPPPVKVPERTAAPPVEERQPASMIPMFATLALVPPTLSSAPPAYADPGQDAAFTTPSITVAEPAALEAGEPIAGPIPLPRAKPHGPIAMATSAIPLPRPRPLESTPLPDAMPAVDRHEYH
ncbi:MAG: hypothetical protein QOF91_2848 [Alphaproteobacteria bacterium]|nr:hypothetical protein [Alphaproteobacteria bacterium]